MEPSHANWSCEIPVSYIPIIPLKLSTLLSMYYDENVSTHVVMLWNAKDLPVWIWWGKPMAQMPDWSCEQPFSPHRMEQIHLVQPMIYRHCWMTGHVHESLLLSPFSLQSVTCADRFERRSIALWERIKQWAFICVARDCLICGSV